MVALLRVIVLQTDHKCSDRPSLVVQPDDPGARFEDVCGDCESPSTIRQGRHSAGCDFVLIQSEEGCAISRYLLGVQSEFYNGCAGRDLHRVCQWG